jgi:hypothetical protein
MTQPNYTGSSGELSKAARPKLLRPLKKVIIFIHVNVWKGRMGTGVSFSGPKVART